MYNIFTLGFIYSLSQIISIGLQNLFLINSGLKKEKNLIIICLVIFFFDSILIALGIFGIGSIIAKNKIILSIVKYVGSLILTYYSISHFRNVFKKDTNRNFDLINEKTQQGNLNIKSIIVRSFVVTYFNPNSFVDIILLLVPMSAGYVITEKMYFYLGCISASFLWFFFIAHFSKKVSYLFRSKNYWTYLDLVTAFIMLFFAFRVFNS